MLPARNRPAWMIWLVLGVVLSAAYPILPSLAVAAAVGGLIGVVSCILSVAGIRHYRPADGGAWFLVIAGQFMCVVGTFTYLVESLAGQGTRPSIADALYLGACPLLTLGLYRLTRDRWLRRSAGLIDSAIIAVSLTILYWVFVIGPTATDGSLPVLTRLVQAGYPTAGVLLFVAVTPMVMRRGRRTASMTLLTVGGVATLAGNVIYTLLPDVTYATSVAFACFLLSYVCWGAAALHPSVRSTPAESVPDPAPEHLGRVRILLLAVSMLLVPAVLLIRRTASVQHLGWLAIGLGSAVLMVLVVVRLSGFVTMAQRQSGQLRELAMGDDLTGLANRRSFEVAANAALAVGSPQVAVIDLADFKNINDRLGRASADRALVAVAARLAATVDAPMVVARVNGDEFALLIPDATADEADLISRRVADSLRQPIVADGHDLLLNVRIGVTGSDGVADAGELLRRADTALDAAKKHGSRFRRYAVELDDHAAKAAQLGAELRHALDRAEFRLVYQPIVELPAGNPVGVEALVRWQHPVRGFVSPADFIPVAEGNGLIIELGAWVMRTACVQAVTWQRELGRDAPGYVSVNVSAHQLAQPDFAQFVASVLAETGLAGPCLLVEVTETAIFSGGLAMQTLERLRDLGVRIALDDFGTGHSSLGLLQNVPVDVLKVDKSFVDNITLSGRHAVIAEALIRLADGLGLEAVAEGVETAEQAAELHRLGYRLVQGYHFGKPVAEPAFLRSAVRL